jgi:hypothetical protein
MELKELDRGELIAILGGLALGISLFLSWFSLGNRYAYVHSCRGSGAGCTGFTSLGPISYILLLIAIVPLVLAWVVVSGSRLTWPRGELTAVMSLIALTLVVFFGIIDRPGWPSGEIDLSIGWFIALLGGALIFLGAITRAQESSRRKKPPGML